METTVTRISLQLVKYIKSNSPILNYLLEQYGDWEDLPKTSKPQSQYNIGECEYFCQIFKTPVTDLSKAIKEHKELIEKAIIYNEISWWDKEKDITYMPSISELACKINGGASKRNLTVKDLKMFKDIKFGLMRMANDGKGLRVFRLEDNCQILSDIGLCYEGV